MTGAMNVFVEKLREEFPTLQEDDGVYRQNLVDHEVFVRDFAEWWTNPSNPKYPENVQADFSGPPYHVTSLSTAFQF